MTAENVRNTGFEKVVRGYRAEDVDAFLDQVAADMERLETQKVDAENKMRILGMKVDEYRGQEETLKTALINAQRMGETVVYEAHQRAENILREADESSDVIRLQTEREYEMKREQLFRLADELARFQQSLRNLYVHQLEALGAFDNPLNTADKALKKFPQQIQGEKVEREPRHRAPDEPLVPNMQDYADETRKMSLFEDAAGELTKPAQQAQEG